MQKITKFVPNYFVKLELCPEACKVPLRRHKCKIVHLVFKNHWHNYGKAWQQRRLSSWTEAVYEVGLSRSFLKAGIILGYNKKLVMKMICSFINWMSQSTFRVLHWTLVATFEGHWQPECMKEKVKQIIKGLEAMS